MDNQHQQITGYRDLTQTEIDLINRVKKAAQECGYLVELLRGYPSAGGRNGTGNPALDHRWINIGATQLQEGFMALTRGIAQPTTF